MCSSSALLQRSFFRRSSMDDDDSAEFLGAGHRHDVGVRLKRDPDLSFSGMGKNVAEQVPRIPARHRAREQVFAGDRLKVQCLRDFAEFPCHVKTVN